MDEGLVTGRFIVRVAFKVTGRGTCIAGYSESGVFHTGDDLRWSDGQTERTARCLAIEIIQVRPQVDPSTIGLVVTGFQPSDFHAGMVIFGSRKSA